MNKPIIILFLLMLIPSFCKAQNVNIVSPWLKARILATNTTTDLRAKDLEGNWLKIDQNNDGEIQVSEAVNVKYYYDANGGYIGTYEGMNSFLNLENLTFGYNQTPAGLDLTGLSNLKTLFCDSNSLTYLNLTGCSALETIHVDQNYLETLDVTGLTELKNLSCQNNNLISLNLNSTPSLVNLLCFSNGLTSLDLSNHSDLEVLNCANNTLVNLAFDDCPNLQLLRCDSNNLQILNLDSYPNLTELYCGYNNLQTLSVNNCSSLVHLDCTNNQLIKLNINNGFNWIPSYDYTGNFRGQNNYNINQVCTSTSSVTSVTNYYSQWTSNVSDCTTLGIDENGGQYNSLAFYPNPANDKIFFNRRVNVISVYDLKGVFIKDYYPTANEVNVSELSAGLYILKAQTENGIEYHKLVLK